MDRRQLLLGATAMGLAGQFDLSQLAHAQSTEANHTPKAKIFYPPDQELDRPRGPVKMCVEETSAFDGSVMTHTWEYGPDGRMLSARSEHDGRPTFSTDGYVHTEVRDDEGRLLKFVSGARGEPGRETYYSYDKAGRLLTTTNNENSDRTEYHYGPDDTKTSVQTFDPKTLERTQRAAHAGSAWEGAQFSGFGVPTGGTVTIQYDKNDRGTEMRILTADGQLVTHIVRKYDSEGRLLEDTPLQQNMAILMLDRMPPEKRASLTPEWIEALNKSMAGKKPPQTTYTYDAQGRFTGKLERNMFFEQTKTVRYNDYGDKIEEQTTFKSNSTIPMGVPQSFDEQGNLIPTAAPERPERSFLPPDYDVRYSYRYDSHGNWTERIQTGSDGFSVTTRRELTYY
jgi:YD repeat-containing protein